MFDADLNINFVVHTYFGGLSMFACQTFTTHHVRTYIDDFSVYIKETNQHA